MPRLTHECLRNTLDREHDAQTLESHMVWKNLSTIRNYGSILEPCLPGSSRVLKLTWQWGPSDRIEAVVDEEEWDDGYSNRSVLGGRKVSLDITGKTRTENCGWDSAYRQRRDDDVRAKHAAGGGQP